MRELGGGGYCHLAHLHWTPRSFATLESTTQPRFDNQGSAGMWAPGLRESIGGLQRSLAGGSEAGVGTNIRRISSGGKKNIVV